MHLCRLILPLLMASGGLSHGGETNYYASLLASVNRSRPGVQQVTNQLLVNTSNTANQARGCLFRLDAVHAGGPIGNIRLGMSIDEVVRAWDKPPQVWWNYQGGLRFDYKHVILYFASNKLSGICINSPALREVKFEPPVPARSAVAAWQQALKTWTLNRTSSATQLLHATNQVLLTLSFRQEDSPVFQLRLEQWAGPPVPLPRSLSRVGASYHPPRDKFEAVVLAKLGALDQGYWLNEHKDPNIAHVMPVVRSNKSVWMVYFEYHRPVPDSGIFAWVNQMTGEVEMHME